MLVPLNCAWWWYKCITLPFKIKQKGNIIYLLLQNRIWQMSPSIIIMSQSSKYSWWSFRFWILISGSSIKRQICIECCIYYHHINLEGCWNIEIVYSIFRQHCRWLCSTNACACSRICCKNKTVSNNVFALEIFCSLRTYEFTSYVMSAREYHHA